jgi:very-short-patch-repair endonuclease
MRFRERLVRGGSKERRRQLRRRSTDAEAVLWRHLRDSRLGAKFRRQHSIGPFIVDFYCPAARLVIELDGGQHYEDADAQYDRWRTAELERHRARVLRFPNDVVVQSPEVVLTVIAEALQVA